MSQMPLFEQKILDLVWILNRRPLKSGASILPMCLYLLTKLSHKLAWI